MIVLRGWDKLFAVISNNKLAFYKDQKHYKTVCVAKLFCTSCAGYLRFWNCILLLLLLLLLLLVVVVLQFLFRQPLFFKVITG